MRKIAITSALLLGMGTGVSAQQQVPTPVVVAPAESPDTVPVPVKVATIFAQNAIVSTQEGQKASAALNAKFAPKKEEFDRKQNELLQLREQLKKNQATFSADAKNRLNQNIDEKTRQVQRLGEDNQAALEEEEGNMLQEIGEKLLAVIQDYGARNGLAVVIDVSVPGGPVLWGSPSIDITSEIVKAYDQAHPVAAPAPAPTAPIKK